MGIPLKHIPCSIVKKYNLSEFCSSCDSTLSQMANCFEENIDLAFLLKMVKDKAVKKKILYDLLKGNMIDTYDKNTTKKNIK